jgi:hypothetical protein
MVNYWNGVEYELGEHKYYVVYMYTKVKLTCAMITSLISLIASDEWMPIIRYGAFDEYLDIWHIHSIYAAWQSSSWSKSRRCETWHLCSSTVVGAGHYMCCPFFTAEIKCDPNETNAYCCSSSITAQCIGFLQKLFCETVQVKVTECFGAQEVDIYFFELYI